ncbi:MAG TPA: MATE family efflux transporter [Actinomycetota bacterium]|nr:MATE family efflux transporter [Actinomycetota bacterium]
MHKTDRAIARLAVPALGSLAVEPLYVLVDTAIVGRIGTAELAGLGLASTVLLVAFAVFNFLAYGTTPRVGFLYGRGDLRGAAGVAVQGLWASAVIGAASVAVLLAGGSHVLRALGGEGAVLTNAETYLRISALGVPAVLVALVGHGYLRGLQDTRTPLVVAAVANALNLVVELWLVFGLGLGIAGSAWSTVIAQWVAAAWFLVLIVRDVSRRDATLRPLPDELRRLATTGRHLVVRTGALLGAFVVASAVAARIGAATLAAHQIAFQVFTFLALAVDALAIAGQALVAKALGAGDVAEVRATSDRLIRFGLACGVVLAAALLIGSRALPAVFTPDGDVRTRATQALVVLALMQVPAAVVFVLDGLLLGASDTRFLQWGTVAGLAVFAPLGAGVLRLPKPAIGWLYGGLTVWMLVRLAFNGLRYRSGAWLGSG